MTGFQVLIGVLLTICMVLRPFLYKPAAVFFNLNMSSLFTFYLFGSLALSSLIDNLCFNEGLKLYQLLCVVYLGVVGVCFFVYGDAKRLSVKNKVEFLLAILMWTSFHVEDHLVISHIGWYPHLLISSVFMFLACFLNKVTINDIKTVFINKYIDIKSKA